MSGSVGGDGHRGLGLGLGLGLGAGLGLATVHSSGRLSRDEEDFEQDDAAGAPESELEQLAAQYAALAAELAEARAAGALQERQLAALKEALREAERAQARVALLGGGGGGHASSAALSPHAQPHGHAHAHAHASAGASEPSSAVSLTFLKNAVVAILVATDVSERRRMVPAIAMLLKLSPEEAARVAAAVDPSSSSSAAAAFLPISIVSAETALVGMTHRPPACRAAGRSAACR